MSVLLWETKGDRKTMKKRRVRKIEDGRTITIAGQDLQRLCSEDSDHLEVKLHRGVMGIELRPELEAAYRRSWNARENAYRYLARH